MQSVTFPATFVIYDNSDYEGPPLCEGVQFKDGSVAILDYEVHGQREFRSLKGSGFQALGNQYRFRNSFIEWRDGTREPMTPEPPVQLVMYCTPCHSAREFNLTEATPDMRTYKCERCGGIRYE